MVAAGSMAGSGSGVDDSDAGAQPVSKAVAKATGKKERFHAEPPVTAPAATEDVLGHNRSATISYRIAGVLSTGAGRRVGWGPATVGVDPASYSALRKRFAARVGDDHAQGASLADLEANLRGLDGQARSNVGGGLLGKYHRQSDGDDQLDRCHRQVRSAQGYWNSGRNTSPRSSCTARCP